MKDNILNVVLDADTSKLQKKLKAIAKYAEALADELSVIDNTCDCGSIEYTESQFHVGDKIYYKVSTCLLCNKETTKSVEDEI